MANDENSCLHVALDNLNKYVLTCRLLHQNKDALKYNYYYNVIIISIPQVLDLAYSCVLF